MQLSPPLWVPCSMCAGLTDACDSDAHPSDLDQVGEGICCYVTLKAGVDESDEVAAELRNQVCKVIGPFATPDYVILTAALPKTRSGKIMRRILRKVAAQQTDAGSLGDVSTLADPGVVGELIDKVGRVLAAAMMKGGGGGGGGGSGAGK